MKRFETLKRRSEFLDIYRKGQNIATKGVIVQAMARGNKETKMPPRFGFTVSAKIGGAVVRNRVKRRLRGVVTEIITKTKNGGFIPGYDYVLVGRKETFDRPFSSLVKDLLYALHKIHG